MEALIGNLVSNPDVLTPLGIYEMFGFFMMLELIGFFFNWIKGGDK